MNQSQFLAIICNSLKAREKSRVHGAIGFGFTSHWLKNWRESFWPITKTSNRVITFDSHLKAAQCVLHLTLGWALSGLSLLVIYSVSRLQYMKQSGAHSVKSYDLCWVCRRLGSGIPKNE